MAFTNLQPAMFMHTLEGGWKAVLERGAIGLPYSKRAKRAMSNTAMWPKWRRER
jgi:hypothetical protein